MKYQLLKILLHRILSQVQSSGASVREPDRALCGFLTLFRLYSVIYISITGGTNEIR